MQHFSSCNTPETIFDLSAAGQSPCVEFTRIIFRRDLANGFGLPDMPPLGIEVNRVISTSGVFAVEL
jgi:hypothetical protein